MADEPGDLRDERIPPTSEPTSERASAGQAPGLLILLTPESAQVLGELARSAGLSAEEAAGQLITRLASSDEADTLCREALSVQPEAGPASIPTTSEIYLDSFLEKSRSEFRVRLDGDTQRALGRQAGKHRQSLGRIGEVLLLAALTRGAEMLEAESNRASSESASLLSRLFGRFFS